MTPILLIIMMMESSSIVVLWSNFRPDGGPRWHVGIRPAPKGEVRIQNAVPLLLPLVMRQHGRLRVGPLSEGFFFCTGKPADGITFWGSAHKFRRAVLQQRETQQMHNQELKA